MINPNHYSLAASRTPVHHYHFMVITAHVNDATMKVKIITNLV